ncbi:hypothetical protein EVAR_32326_1 [Eumeta japonica]|uniref:Uncharacterized protein n=1 Tax=Eumeta variegata TaxID=151549 RepID=A0A4C1ZAG6_EUMVA|nr:hypothetical protein EVAR_32326_1 [Eumeta japonica]
MWYPNKVIGNDDLYSNGLGDERQAAVARGNSRNLKKKKNVPRTATLYLARIYEPRAWVTLARRNTALPALSPRTLGVVSNDRVRGERARGAVASPTGFCAGASRACNKWVTHKPLATQTA